MAGQHNVTIEPGTTFELPLTWHAASTPVNLTNYQARLNVRASKASSPTFIASTQNGGAAATPVTGQLYFILTPAQTQSITFSRGYYEVELYTLASTPFVFRLLKGSITIDRS